MFKLTFRGLAIPERYVMTLLGFLLTILGSTMKYAVSIALTEMVVSKPNSVVNGSVQDPFSCPYPNTGSSQQVSLAEKTGSFDWSPSTQGLITGAVFWTYTTLQIPLGLVVERYGYRYVLAVGVLICNVSYLLTPLVIYMYDAPGFITARVINGAGLAFVYPSLNVMLAKWAPPSEKSKLGAIIYAGLAIPERYVMTLLGFLLTILGSTMKYAVSIALTEMVVSKPNSVVNGSVQDPLSCPYPNTGSSQQVSLTEKTGSFDWSPSTQGLITGAVFWTYTTLQIPLGLVVERYGYRYVLAVGVLICNVSYLLTPLVIYMYDAPGFITARVINGAGLAFVYPSLNVMLAKWAPPSEKSKLGAIIYAGENLGFIFSMAVSGLLLGSAQGDWSLLFYVYGTLGMIWLVLWWMLGYDTPGCHPFISLQEREYLESSLKSKEFVKLPPTPWRAMAFSLPLWGTVLAQIGHDWSIITIVTELPQYMKSVLHYDIEANGLLTAIPYAAMTLVAMLSGWLSDWILEKQHLSITNCRKLFTSIAAVGPAAGVVAALNAGCDSGLAVGCFTVGLALMGFYYPSLSVNTLDLSPNYSGTLMGLIAFGGLGGIISPYLAGVLAPDETMVQWRNVFWVAIVFLLLTNSFYLVVGSGEVQPWNQPDNQPNLADDHKFTGVTVSKVVDERDQEVGMAA